FDRKLDSVLSLLHSLPDVEPQFVHGDICPENILVDSSGAPTALLDWGFFTTAGDNSFEASCAAGFFDMYGPDARSVDDTLVRRFADELGHPVELQLLYRAAYAIAGANSYGADGADGHFMWCAAALNRDDVTERLLTAAVWWCCRVELMPDAGAGAGVRPGSPRRGEGGRYRAPAG